MATYVKYDNFVQVLMNKEVDLFGTTDTVRAVIHTDAPVVASDTTTANLTQITGTGYTAADINNDATRTGGTVTMTGVDYTWVAGAADWTTTARYVSIYDDTAASPTADPLIAYWDYGTTFAVGNGETFTLDWGASILSLT
ncbi:MAG: hypothetical protein ABFE08_17760 [Armatimonadia bacterium]